MEVSYASRPTGFEAAEDLGQMTGNTTKAVMGNVTKFVSLGELAEQVPSGASIGVGGVHLARLPIALIETVLKLGRKDFTFVSWGGGLPLELFLEGNALRKLVFCFSSLDILGLAPRWKPAASKSKNGPRWP